MGKVLRSIALCLVVVLGLVAVDATTDAVAQSPPDGGGADEARKRMERGQSYFVQGKYREAMEEFEAAYKAQPFGAFLYNAAFAAEKAGDRERAIERYEAFLAADPAAPDADDIKKTIQRLKDELAQPPPEPVDAGADAGDAGVPVEPVAPPTQENIDNIRSLVFISSEPPGAPLSIYKQVVPTAEPFVAGRKNPGWRMIVTGIATPNNLSLKVGTYHVVIEAFRDFKPSETHMVLAPGHVYTFKANLSQGEFMGALFVKSKVEGARIYLDDPPPHKNAPWGRGTHQGQLQLGEHEVWIVAPGYAEKKHTVNIEQGKTLILDADLERVDYGYLVVDGNAAQIEVKIDDQPKGVYRQNADPVKLKLQAGKHNLWLDAEGRKTFIGEVTVPAGQELPVHAELAETYGRGQAVAMGLIGAGAAVGGVFLFRESLTEDDKPGPAGFNCAAVECTDEDRRDLFRYLGIGAFGVAGLLTAGSIFFSIYDPNPDSALKRSDPNEFPKDYLDKKQESARRLGPRVQMGVSPVGAAVTGTF